MAAGAVRTCLKCQVLISKRQDQLKCRICSRWQHRTCQTGMSRALYWQRLKSQVFQWNCVHCNRDEGHIGIDAENDTGNYNTQGNDLINCLNIYHLLLDYFDNSDYSELTSIHKKLAAICEMVCILLSSDIPTNFNINSQQLRELSIVNIW